jgi:dTDP-4-dehydrorhamnose reductase
LKILLTGRAGQLGWELERTLSPLAEVMAFDRGGLDLADPRAIARVARAAKPQLIVNAAAYTAVDRAETESESAHAINAVAPEILAREAGRLGAALIHYSTDYVFDGNKAGAYDENDAANPAGMYGRSKLLGEQAIAASGVPHLIFRASWVYSARGRNFLLTMLRLAREKPEIAVVADQFGAPTWARMIAEATAQVIARCGTAPDRIVETIRAQRGVYHLAAAGRTSWHGFAEALLREAGLATPVRPIATSGYPLSAPRPMNSELSCLKLAARFGIALPDWETSMRLCLAEIEPRR